MKKITITLVLVLAAAVFAAPVKAATILQINGETVVNTGNVSTPAAAAGATKTIATGAFCPGATSRSTLTAANLNALYARLQELMQKIAAIRLAYNSMRQQDGNATKITVNGIPATQTVGVNTNAGTTTVTIPSANPTPKPASTSIPTSGSATVQINAAVKNDIFAATNNERDKYLGAGHRLKQSAVLDKVAADRVADMFKNQYFSHTSPLGAGINSLANQYGYVWRTIGENIAYGTYSGGTQIVNGWMASAGHKANILSSSFTEIGVGAAYGNYKGRNVWIAVQVFGTPR